MDEVAVINTRCTTTHALEMSLQGIAQVIVATKAMRKTDTSMETDTTNLENEISQRMIGSATATESVGT